MGFARSARLAFNCQPLVYLRHCTLIKAVVTTTLVDPSSGIFFEFINGLSKGSRSKRCCVCPTRCRFAWPALRQLERIPAQNNDGDRKDYCAYHEERKDFDEQPHPRARHTEKHSEIGLATNSFRLTSAPVSMTIAATKEAAVVPALPTSVWVWSSPWALQRETLVQRARL